MDQVSLEPFHLPPIRCPCPSHFYPTAYQTASSRTMHVAGTGGLGRWRGKSHRIQNQQPQALDDLRIIIGLSF